MFLYLPSNIILSYYIIPNSSMQAENTQLIIFKDPTEVEKLPEADRSLLQKQEVYLSKLFLIKIIITGQKRSSMPFAKK